MWGLLGGLGSKFKVVKKIRVDSVIFRLHYRVTVTLLFACCVLVTANSLIGNPIECIHDKLDDGAFSKAVNTYCWISSTFTLPKYFHSELGVEVPHHGIGPHTDDDEKVYHSYYIWVPFVLFFQGLLFYTPHWIWKTLEADRLKTIIQGLDSLVFKKEEREQKIQALAAFIVRSKGNHNMWVLNFIFCEFLCFINVFGNIFFTDRFLGYEFTTLGTKVLQHTESDPEVRSDPLSQIFPRVTKCTWHQYGPSGTIQKYDTMCVLAQNIINEKVYIFLWFWFVLLSLITGFLLVYRLFTILLKPVRVAALRGIGRSRKQGAMVTIVSNLSIGDYFLVYHLGRNMDAKVYGEFMSHLAKMLEADKDAYMDTKPV